jgi:polyhydroxybutyrate depolymerase
MKILSINNLMKQLLLFMLFYFSNLALIGQVSESIPFDGLNRSYIYYLPSNYSVGTKVSLVFVLHGFTQNGQTIMEASKFNELAEENNFIVVYPNGVGNAWNTDSGFPGGSTADDVGYIKHLIEYFKNAFSVIENRVYACGFSAGGFLSHYLACDGSVNLRAIASVAGTMTSNAFNKCTSPQKLPVLQIHGTSDVVVSFNGSFANISVQNTINLWLYNNGCSTTPIITSLENFVNEGSSVEKQEYLACDNQSEVALLKIINGGHTWPSASTSFGTGNVNFDINASREIWSFFNRFDQATNTLNSMNEEISFYVSPNPSNDYIFVHSPEKELTTDYQIFNAENRLMTLGKVTNTKNSIAVNNLSSGMYLIYFQESNKPIKFIKE